MLTIDEPQSFVGCIFLVFLIWAVIRIPEEGDMVGKYRADYSPLTDEEMDSDPCAGLFTRSIASKSLQ